MVILALISILIVVLDYANQLNISKAPWSIIDNTILIIFAADYFIRLSWSPNKWTFFKNNIFDLLAILPFNSIFSFFRVSRVFRIFRLAKSLRFLRLLGLTGKLQNNLHRFLKTNGLIYLIWISISILLISATLYSLAENVPWGETLWWAIATTTTVGYGDISPHTTIGKLAAILLMFVGIGFIGMLTSAITSFFTTDAEKSKNQQLMDQLEVVTKQNEEIKQRLAAIEQQTRKWLSGTIGIDNHRYLAGISILC